MFGETHRGLTLRVWLPSDRFGVGDTVRAYCILENTGSEIIEMVYWMVLGPHLRLFLTTPDGLEVTLHLVGKALIEPSADAFATLRPRHLIGRLVDVPVSVIRNEWLGQKGEEDAHDWDIGLAARMKGDMLAVWKLGLGPPPSGSYQIHAEFDLRGSAYDGRRDGIEAWTGVLVSQKVPIYLGFDKAPDHGHHPTQERRETTATEHSDIGRE